MIIVTMCVCVERRSRRTIVVSDDMRKFSNFEKGEYSASISAHFTQTVRRIFSLWLLYSDIQNHVPNKTMDQLLRTACTHLLLAARAKEIQSEIIMQK